MSNLATGALSHLSVELGTGESECHSYLLERQECDCSWYIGAKPCRRPKGQPYYWHWTTDVTKAVRFSRKEDAENCWQIIKNQVGEGGSFTRETLAVEHIFYSA